ncbi:MAG: urease accessory protein UreE [Phenylobacterium sp.]|uniref:urease accessory protein UreE n=1 Tax=Phenylobacterium sp. TaxID=1871053 RepID=UPI002733EDA3|nr:urease accessory protein UreE [Phenylobacterium sp.]MDP3175913.1 urease accessory protein UreE [Phenylobacterium sp.]
MLDVQEILRSGVFAPDSATDLLVLDHDHRLRRRIVLTTAAGLRVRLYEARPVQLRDGDGLRLADGSLVLVRAADEDVLEITAPDAAGLVRIAWHLGNRHLPTQLMGEAIRIRFDHVIAAMVEGLGASCRRIDAPFDPEGGAYADGGHDEQAHGHGHQAHGDHQHPHAHA